MDGNELDEVYECEENNSFSDLALQCSERLSQMTKTYNDVEAVTKLLEEKEKDLELAAKIGKTLLERNKELQQTNEFLEEQLNIANEQVTQLKHELQQKIDLLHVFTDSEIDSGGSTPSGDRCIGWGTLQKKLKLLEEENITLKLEAGHLKSLTQGLEEKEQQLVNDCFRQLAEANSSVEDLSLELAEKSEEYAVQQREISHLLKELVDKQNSEKRLNYENEELGAQIHAAQETQLELTQELIDLQERYAEVVALLTETREELKSMKEKFSLKGKTGSPGPDSMYDSLASEIEASDSSFGGFSPFLLTKKEDYAKQIEPVFVEGHNNTKSTVTTPTVDDRQRRGRIVELDDSLDTFRSTSSFTSTSTAKSLNSDVQVPPDGCDAKTIVKAVENSLLVPVLPHATSTESLTSYPAPGLGVPGIPGSKDLEFAIKRLSLRRRVELECQKYKKSKGAAFYYSPFSLVPSVTAPVYHPTHGLDQLLNVETSTPPVSAASQPIPCKSKTLLVKPLEGSSTLNQWKELATPSLAGALEKRSGIKVKGGSPPTVQPSNSPAPFSTPSQYWSASPWTSGEHGGGPDSGVSSDVDGSTTTSVHYCERRTISTPGTYSIVSSKVMHPSDRPSYVYIPPRTTSHDNSPSESRVSLSSSPGEGTSTFSVAYNLASSLKERCVDLVASNWWLHPVRSSPMATHTTDTAVPVSSCSSNETESKIDGKKILAAKLPYDKPTGLCSLLSEDSNKLTSPSVQSQSGIVTRSSARLLGKDSDPVD